MSDSERKKILYYKFPFEKKSGNMRKKNCRNQFLFLIILYFISEKTYSTIVYSNASISVRFTVKSDCQTIKYDKVIYTTLKYRHNSSVSSENDTFTATGDELVTDLSISMLPINFITAKMLQLELKKKQYLQR